MNIILWVIFGAMSGWIASLIADTREGILADIVLGIVGALLGGLIMNAFGQPGVTGFNVYSFIVAIVGAIILLLIGQAFRSGGRPTT